MEGIPGERLKGVLGESFDAEVQRKADSFGGLLTRDAAIRLLCQENGISTEENIVLSQARLMRLPFSFSARVGRVFPVQHFPPGAQKSVRLHVSDSSGEATLVLWNEQAAPVEGGSMLAGEQVECSGAYFRSGEIFIGRGGSAARVGKSSAVEVSALSEGVQNVEGTVDAVEGLREYVDRQSGERRCMLPFTICSGGACCRAVWWSPPEGAELRKGDEVVLEGASFRGGELHLNNYSRTIAKSKAGKREGKFAGISFDGGEAIIRVGGSEFSTSIPEALSLFGLPPAMQGILPQTALSIKAGQLAGKQAGYFLDGGKLASLQFQG